jgi:hypothetical protein
MYTLTPKPKPLVTDGVISYDTSCRARTMIRLKKEIVHEFEDLKNKDKLVNYKLEYHRDFNKLQERVSELNLKGDGLPFLLFIYSKDVAEAEA